MRLINAEELFDKVGQIKPQSKEHYKNIGEFMNLITNSSTIDAVEVVRCKDCKYGEERIEDYRCWMLDEDWDIRFSPMHFCSYGRHREESEVEE